jgi:exonuclease III
MRWIGEGILGKKNHMIFFSCHKKNHMFGTGFIINKKIKHLVMDFKAKSHTMCRLRIRGLFLTIVFFCVHGSTEEKSEKEKDAFYDNLDKIYDECPQRDI